MRGLHPIDDGLVDLTPNVRIRKFDAGGNRLVDIVDPQTGMCTGVRSPLSTNGQTVIEPTSVSAQPNKDIRDIRVVSGQYVDMSNIVQNGPNTRSALVVRTCADGDDPLPVTRVTVDSPEMSKKAAAEAKRRKREDWEIGVVLRHMNYSGVVSPELRASVLGMIRASKSQKSVSPS